MEMTDLDYKSARAALAALMESAGLTVAAEFIPFSQSRSAAEKSPSLNWRVTLKCKGRDVLTTDYSAGCAHCPGYSNATYSTYEGRAVVKAECETGKRHKWFADIQAPVPRGNADKGLIMPDPVDVMSSVAMDADVLDSGGFEEWAADFGYDTDSRKAESIYQACLEIALKLRAVIGDAALTQARDLVRQM